VLIVGRIYEED